VGQAGVLTDSGFFIPIARASLAGFVFFNRWLPDPVFDNVAYCRVQDIPTMKRIPIPGVAPGILSALFRHCKSGSRKQGRSGEIANGEAVDELSNQEPTSFPVSDPLPFPDPLPEREAESAKTAKNRILTPWIVFWQHRAVIGESENQFPPGSGEFARRAISIQPIIHPETTQC